MLTPDLVDFLESGVSIQLASRDASLVPECTRVMGVRALPDRERCLLYLPKASSERVVENLRDNGRVAFTFTRPIDHRTYQIKGLAEEIRDATDEERLVVECYRAALSAHLDVVGVARRMTLRWAHWPAWAILVRVTDIFAQTPGPTAGARLERS